MKQSNKVRTFLCGVLAVAVLTAFAAMAAGGAGSQTDPLVTLSYLTGSFTGQIMDKVDGLLAGRLDVRSSCAPAPPAAPGQAPLGWWTPPPAAAWAMRPR